MAGRPIEIPEDLYAKLEGLLETLGFDSVEACVAFIVRAAITGDAAAGPLSDDEIAEMKERLADLGYL